MTQGIKVGQVALSFGAGRSGSSPDEPVRSDQRPDRQDDQHSRDPTPGQAMVSWLRLDAADEPLDGGRARRRIGGARLANKLVQPLFVDVRALCSELGSDEDDERAVETCLARDLRRDGVGASGDLVIGRGGHDGP